MTSGQKRPSVGDLVIPDLEVPQRPVSRAPAPRTATPRSVALELDTNLAGAEAPGAAMYDVGSEALSVVDLDTDDALERSNVRAVESVRVHQNTHRRKWPTGETPDSVALHVPHDAIIAAGGYGDVPPSALFAPAYTFRVWQRRRSLRARVDTLRTELDALERKRDELLASIAEARLSHVPGRAGAVGAADELIEERRRALAGASAQFEIASTSIAERLKSVDQRTNEKMTARAARASELEKAEEEFRRTEAKHQRCFIELRPFAELVEKRTPLSEEQTRRIRQLEAQVAAIAPHLDAAKEHVRVAIASLGATDRDLEQQAKERRDIERQRRMLEVDLTNEIRGRSAELDQARDARTSLLADVGREILRSRGKIPVEDALLERLLADESIIAETASALDTHLRALDAYDSVFYKKGFSVLAAFIVATALFVVWLVM